MKLATLQHLAEMEVNISQFNNVNLATQQAEPTFGNLACHHLAI